MKKQHMRTDKYLWIYVSADKYEFPLAIALSSNELGEMIGVDGTTIRTAVYHAEKRGHSCRYKKVKVTEEEYKEFLEELNNE